MELEVKNIRYVYKGKNLLNGLSFKVSSSDIIGITGPNKTVLLEILDLEKKYQGDILINNVLINNGNKLKYQREIALVHQANNFYTTVVSDEMKFVIDYYQYNSRDLKKRMKDALKLVGLSEGCLTRKISTLSSSEKVLVKVACCLITNPKVILFDETFVGLDYNSKCILFRLIKKLKERKDKLIVVASSDVDLLYQLTSKLIVLEDGTIVKNGDTFKIMKDQDFLTTHNIDVPYLVKFTDLARAKKVKLSHHRDILDLIKDVYRHV